MKQQAQRTKGWKTVKYKEKTKNELKNGINTRKIKYSGKIITKSTVKTKTLDK